MEKCSLFYFLKNSPSFRLITPLPDQGLCINEFCASFALRYYLNKRLKTTFASFISFYEKDASLFSHGIEYLGFKKEQVVFNDQVIAGYFDLLQQEKQLAPLIQLIGQFHSFDFIKSPLFIKEFLILLCIIYKDLLLENKTSRESINTITELYALSIEELLDVIDTITSKYGKKTFAKTRPARKSSSVIALIEDHYNVSPDAFTTLVFHRYYYIKRLEDIVETLLKLTQAHRFTTSLSIKTNLLLKPLPLVWQEFIAYKEVCNEQLINDFTKEIFVLSQQISHTPLTHHYAQVLQTFLSKQPTVSKETADLNDFKPSIETNRVISRFYLIKRLEPILTKLTSLYQNNLLHLGCSSTTTGSDPCLHHLNITKDPIKGMIHRIYQTHSFKPVFTMWNGISRYKYIQDEELCNEFARFITHLLHSTATHLGATRCKEIFIEGKGFLPLDQLHDMPLEDILNLLDLLVEGLPTFLKENEISSTIEWKEWLKKYWLIAPLRAAIFSISIYLMYKGILAKPDHHHPIQEHSTIPKADSL
jgi:hypothetical protein